MSDPFADLFPRRRERVAQTREAFVEHARRVLLARWGTSLSQRGAVLPNGTTHPFPLVSGNGRIVGDVAWLADVDAPEQKSAALSERVWVVSHVGADRRFVLVGQDVALVSRWVVRHRGMFDGVEIWYLEGDSPERLA